MNPSPIPPELVRPLARFQLLLSMAIGFLWGPLTYLFVRRLAAEAGYSSVAYCAALALGLGFVGSRVPARYVRIRPWELRNRGRVYERYFRIRAFKRWMSDGDWMNSRLRRYVPDYRVVRPARASVAAYADRAETIERGHLAWFLGALAPLGFSVAIGAYGFAALWTAVNLITNVWPVLLQRYNRVRAERVAAARRRATTPPWPKSTSRPAPATAQSSPRPSYKPPH